MIYRDGLVGAAGQTAPTKGYEPTLKNVSVVVIIDQRQHKLSYKKLDDESLT